MTVPETYIVLAFEGPNKAQRYAKIPDVYSKDEINDIVTYLSAMTDNEFNKWHDAHKR